MDRSKVLFTFCRANSLFCFYFSNFFFSKFELQISGCGLHVFASVVYMLGFTVNVATIILFYFLKVLFAFKILPMDFYIGQNSLPCANQIRLHGQFPLTCFAFRVN